MRVWIHDFNGSQIVLELEEQGYHPEVLADLRRQTVLGYREMIQAQVDAEFIAGSESAVVGEDGFDALPPDPTTA